MSNKQIMMIAGILCLVICGVCCFVAYERYQANANNVKAMNSLQQSSPLGGMIGNMKPTTPAATKYALVFAVLSGLGGAVLLVAGGKQKQGVI